MDIGQGLGNALQNKLILQYLSGIGGAMSAGQPVGPAMNAITQQNIQSQNLMKLLKQMLGPDKTKGTFDSSGMTVKIPNEAMSEMLQGTGPGGVWEGLAAPLGTPKSMTTPAQEGSRPTTINPFTYSQSNLDGISPSDLAGLTSQDIMGTFGLKQQAMANATEAAYKESLMRKAEQPDTLDTEFPVPVPEIGKVTHREWSALPTEDKSYALYVAGARNAGVKDIMTKENWKAATPTEKERFLRSAMSDPKLMKAAKELATAGATSISVGELVNRKEALEEVERRSSVMKPDYFSKIEKDLGKPDVWAYDNQGAVDRVKKKYPTMSDVEAAETARKVAILEQADGEIKRAFPGAVFNRDGWYLNGKKIVESPYAR